jgi:site-specific recombinase XerC
MARACGAPSLARLQIFDIDSRRMVVHIRGGKGRRDRDVMLSPVLLEALRDYWRGLKRKPTDCLFPGGNGHTANCPITPKTIYYACCQAARQAGLQNRVHPHTLRHCFATHEPCDFCRQTSFQDHIFIKDCLDAGAINTTLNGVPLAGPRTQ